MLAKFPGQCASCNAPIRPGDKIASIGEDSRTWRHADCGPELVLPGLTPASATPRAARSTVARSTVARSTVARSTVARSGAARSTVARSTRTTKVPMAVPAGAVTVYTDGACSGNPGPGGWAWAIDREHYASGSEKPSTNQRMEIRAALEAVTELGGPLLVVSDSTYVVNCFRDQWWAGWLERGWLTSQKKPVANRDLWEPLVHAVTTRGDVAFHWVKGHSGHEMNDLVDQLAVAASLAD